jgi:UDP-N-acetylglucosamine 2-epimerase (non-hydrolysing)
LAGSGFSMKSYRPIGGRASANVPGSLVLVVAGTRPEAIKVAPVVWALGNHQTLRAVVVNSGQHPDAVRTTFAEFGIRSDVELDSLPALPNLRASFEHLRAELAAVAARFRPGCVLVQGDTLTTYAGAAAAREGGVPVAHVEAGLRTESASDPFPEEWIRRRIARVADIHFAPTAAAAAHLRAEGVPADAIHRTGNTGIDSLRWMLGELRREKFPSDAPRDCVLITLHRRENYDRNADVVCRALIRLSDARPDLRMLFPVHPNPRVSEPIRRRLGSHHAFSLVAPMPYREFIDAAASAALIISDSGSIQEEAPHLGTPLLVPRCNTERPEGIATGFVQLVRVDEDAIVDAAQATLAEPRRPAVPIDRDAPFGAGDAAHRIVSALEAVVAERAYA